MLDRRWRAGPAARGAAGAAGLLPSVGRRAGRGAEVGVSSQGVSGGDRGQGVVGEVVGVRRRAVVTVAVTVTVT